MDVFSLIKINIRLLLLSNGSQISWTVVMLEIKVRTVSKSQLPGLFENLTLFYQK